MGNVTNLKDVELVGQTPRWEGDHLIGWCSFMSPGVMSESPSLLIQGLFLKAGKNFKLILKFQWLMCFQDITGGDPSAWTITGWMYNGIVYGSTEEFRTSLADPEFERVPFNLDGPWTVLEDFGPGVNGRELPPPVMVQTTPPRYGIDRKQNYVSWSKLR